MVRSLLTLGNGKGTENTSHMLFLAMEIGTLFHFSSFCLSLFFIIEHCWEGRHAKSHVGVSEDNLVESGLPSPSYVGSGD